MPQLFKNNARATLGGSGLSSAVGADGTFSVATGKGALFPGIDPIVAGTYFDVTIQDSTNIEIIRIKRRASDVFTIDSRAREGTTASTFASGAIVSLRLTGEAVQNMLAHPDVASNAHSASAVSNAPAGNIAATTVQAAINELDTEKEAVGVAASTMSTHTAAPDPHPQYALDTDLTAGLAGKQTADPQLDTLAAITAQQAADLASLSGFFGTLLNKTNSSALGAYTAAPGQVVFYAMNSVPAGWLHANGAAISRTVYADLFAAIGTVFGAGDGSTSFNIPDLRAEFIRGADGGRGVDSGRVFGSVQAQQIEAHAHTGGMNAASLGGGAAGSAVGTGPVNTGTTGGGETRPRNVAMLPCIKY